MICRVATKVCAARRCACLIHPAAPLLGTLSASIRPLCQPTPLRACDPRAATSVPDHPASHTQAVLPATRCAAPRCARKTPTAATRNGTQIALTLRAPSLRADALTCAAMSAPAIAAAPMTTAHATMPRAARPCVRKMPIAATPSGTAFAQVSPAIPVPPRMRLAQCHRAAAICCRVAACPARCQTAQTRVAADACAWSTRSAVTRPGTSPA